MTRHIPEELALEGMPARAKQRSRARAQAQQQDGFLLTLEAPHYAAALNHLADRELRRHMYEAPVTGASDHGPRTPRIVWIRGVRPSRRVASEAVATVRRR